MINEFEYEGVETAKIVVQHLREYRQLFKVPFKTSIVLFIDENCYYYNSLGDEFLKKLGNVSDLFWVDGTDMPDNIFTFVVNGVIYYINSVIKPPEKELERLRAVKDRLYTKLSNPNFIQNAPANIVAESKQKYEDVLLKIKSL